MKKLYSQIGAILGFIIIILYALENAAGLFEVSFEGMEDILMYFNLVKEYLVYALAGLAGLEFTSGKPIVSLAFKLILVFVILATFFQDILLQYLP